ncbi:beta-galactosidase [Candidatus Parcubacteria bacterium]|nr:beta-galactosidase [Candidatus Parcubacteria bacterium]
MRSPIKYFFVILILFILIIGSYFFIGQAPQQEKITWGVSFSQKHAQALGLNWQETYIAILDDLNVKNLRLIAYWDLIEPEKDDYNFQDLDWQIDEAEKRDVEIILAMGMKTPRWPECHIPDWAENLSTENREKEILDLSKQIVSKYEDSSSIIAWQVENEPFFEFGECPEISEEFLKQEIDLVKMLDYKDRPIIITESGTGSFWFKGAELGDIVGISLYRKVWFHKPKIYVSYPSPSVFYWRKAQIIQRLFNKEVICAELQAEPWGPVLLYDLPIEEQKKTMDLEKFKENIAFARKTGLKEFYLWGGEWWYWMKETQGDSSIWDEVKQIINN